MPDEKFAKVKALVKEKTKSLPSNITDSTQLEIKLDGEVVARYCNKCKRYRIGATSHFTSGHKGRSKDKGGGSDASATASLAAIEEQPAMMRCEIPDYDTPVLVQGYTGAVDNDESSVDSCLNAFMADVEVSDTPSAVNHVVPNGLTLNFFRGQGL